MVVQSDDLNLSTIIVAPTSASTHPYVFRPEVTVRGEPTRLMLDQLRAVDVEKAIGERVGRLSPAEMVEVNRLLRAVLDIL
ncbi:type II toxin-antitoxin system PemK/MazF family toxin [Solwaraspora sp. WMMA2080]|uniref:type II toxin-antitoxin system PemK/MazF family toxin n=1 Tax=unclassified Solwaraspora TaxID=2627926 RepID=UPI00248CCC52|nr:MULTISPECIES: type II toxin-antitoxin system PemK/MazF family toxin [unclassified Solwaraspora]WBB96272.1 type II toxin-antitoxin system PemK/MazF family toxin [Solwaraspora sp. WMMA2059]WBC19825.1 type II toxin-antitoxin system PemK/MazF family toxin [Solwaraspora sp. WMMA2080]